MAKGTPSFVAERKIITTNEYDVRYLEKLMDMVNRIYNVGVKHYRKVVAELRDDVWFKRSFAMWKKAEPDSPEQKAWSDEVSACLFAYGISEYSVHAYLGYCKVSAYDKGIGINVVQKAGTALYASIKKAVFAGTRIHYRKYGQTASFEDKKATSGIIYNDVNGTVKVMGRVFRLKPVRKKDYWLMEALTHKVKYCRIVRKPFKTGYRYYLQIVLQGTAPEKLTRGTGRCGIDEGVSAVSFVNNTEASFRVLANGVEQYEKAIRRAQVKYERRRRIANPDCFEDDGRIKKGARFTNRTKGIQRSLFELKDAYRRKTAFVKDSHGALVNHIVSNCDEIIKEPMNYRALHRRTKGPAVRQDKASTVKTKDGTEKQVFKYKKKKRFGRSIGRRSPGLFNTKLEQKALKYGVKVNDVENSKYKASQYDHSTGTYTKHSLSDRGKIIDSHKVQRDLYSAFLLANYHDMTKPDRKRCTDNFKVFLKHQGEAVARVIREGDTTGNFGLKQFLKHH